MPQDDSHLDIDDAFDLLSEFGMYADCVRSSTERIYDIIRRITFEDKDRFEHATRTLVDTWNKLNKHSKQSLPPYAYRSRILENANDANWKECIHSDMKELRALDANKASLNRCNKDGVSMFYGSRSAISNLLEINASQGSFVQITKFNMPQEVRVAKIGAMHHLGRTQCYPTGFVLDKKYSGTTIENHTAETLPELPNQPNIFTVDSLKTAQGILRSGVLEDYRDALRLSNASGTTYRGNHLERQLTFAIDAFLSDWMSISIPALPHRTKEGLLDDEEQLIENSRERKVYEITSLIAGHITNLGYSAISYPGVSGRGGLNFAIKGELIPRNMAEETFIAKVNRVLPYGFVSVAIVAYSVVNNGIAKEWQYFPLPTA